MKSSTASQPTAILHFPPQKLVELDDLRTRLSTYEVLHDTGLLGQVISDSVDSFADWENGRGVWAGQETAEVTQAVEELRHRAENLSPAIGSLMLVS